MTVPQPGPRRRKPLDAGVFQGEICSFRLHLAAEGKAAMTVRTYTDAVAWFAAAHLIPAPRGPGGSRSTATMCSGGWSFCWPGTATRMPATSTGRCSSWLAEEEQIPDPMARLRAPKVTEKLVPVFSSGEPSALERTCQGRTFAQRRDAAVIAVLKASGIRGGELAGIRYHPDDASRGDLDLQQRDHRPRQGRQAPGRQDRARGSAGCGPLHPDPVKACAGVAAAVVARGE